MKSKNFKNARFEKNFAYWKVKNHINNHIYAGYGIVKTANFLIPSHENDSRIFLKINENVKIYDKLADVQMCYTAEIIIS